MDPSQAGCDTGCVQPAPGPRPATILTVCTGNICRSPAVERLLAHALPEVRVTSAGVRAVVGAPVSPPMAALLVEAGVRADGFAAQQLTEALVREADLVLALTRGHRSAIVDLVPSAVRRTFTLRELARFAAAVGGGALPATDVAERLRALVPLAAAQRGRVQVDPADDDVVDPYGGGDRLYAVSFAQLRPAVEAIAAVVRPAIGWSAVGWSAVGGDRPTPGGGTA